MSYYKTKPSQRYSYYENSNSQLTHNNQPTYPLKKLSKYSEPVSKHSKTNKNSKQDREQYLTQRYPELNLKKDSCDNPLHSNKRNNYQPYKASKQPSYMAKTKTKNNFNLEIGDIDGTTPKTYFRKLEEKISRAKRMKSPEAHNCGRFDPNRPSLIDLKKDYDNPQSHIIDVDIKAYALKQGIDAGVQSGKYIMVKGKRKYLDTANKEQYIDKRREQFNENNLIFDLSKSPDRPDKELKDIRNGTIKGKPRRDCSQNYKYIGKPEPKRLVNKADLRFDVNDINQKNINFIPKELENDPEYLAYVAHVNKAKREGYTNHFSSKQITDVIQFHQGKRLFKSNSQININDMSHKRAASPLRSVSQRRIQKVHTQYKITKRN